MILKEILISFIFSFLSITVVIAIFVIAYRNLIHEKRLSELKTDFINNMTHELKTPLSTITVASKSLEMGVVSSDETRVKEIARLIGTQSVSLNHLINLILEISIWERAEFEPEFRQIALGPVLTDTVESFKAGCHPDATITSNINLEGISLSADITYFTTMINNLLSNALKYTQNKPIVHVEALYDGHNIIIRVSDNGVGIKPEHQKVIFDKFYRIPHGDIHKTKGLGLGLYYVERIALSHGGRVDLKSTPCEGSVFTITLPHNKNSQ